MTPAAEQTYPFELVPLPYGHSELEPDIDARTLATHHGAHHAGYVKKLNEAMSGNSELHRTRLLDLLSRPQQLPESIRKTALDNGGGHLNHDLYWRCLSPRGGRPEDIEGSALAAALQGDFGSIERFVQEFTARCVSHFASGWVALAVAPDGRLSLVNLPNHAIVPAPATMIAICDVWEHAYYLGYQQKRADYVAAFWRRFDWRAMAEQHEGLEPAVEALQD